MFEIGRRRRGRPAPPNVVFEALRDPDHDPARPWLELLDDERRPTVVRSEAPATLIWSSLWNKRPDAIVEFHLPAAANGGTELQRTLCVEEPIPDDALVGHLRKRFNQLINANLRSTFGQ